MIDVDDSSERTRRQAPIGEAQDRQGERFGESARRLAGVAAQLLRWTPETFWNATPAELCDALMPPGEGGEPPSKTAIEALMARFPDQRR